MGDYALGLLVGVGLGLLALQSSRLRKAEGRRCRDVEQADYLSRRRFRLLPFMVILFMSQQAIGLSHLDDGMGNVEHLRLTAWLLFSALLLATLFTGGFWSSRKEIRALIDDEGTRENRRRALGTGFVATMLTGVAAYVISFFEPLGGREVAHLMIMVAIGAALLAFSHAERRALRDGCVAR
jgi:MFS family permease